VTLKNIQFNKLDRTICPAFDSNSSKIRILSFAENRNSKRK
jgi:hypothetical protein